MGATFIPNTLIGRLYGAAQGTPGMLLLLLAWHLSVKCFFISSKDMEAIFSSKSAHPEAADRLENFDLALGLILSFLLANMRLFFFFKIYALQITCSHNVCVPDSL